MTGDGCDDCGLTGLGHDVDFPFLASEIAMDASTLNDRELIEATTRAEKDAGSSSSKPKGQQDQQDQQEQPIHKISNSKSTNEEAGRRPLRPVRSTRAQINYFVKPMPPPSKRHKATPKSRETEVKAISDRDEKSEEDDDEEEENQQQPIKRQRRNRTVQSPPVRSSGRPQRSKKMNYFVAPLSAFDHELV